MWEISDPALREPDEALLDVVVETRTFPLSRPGEELGEDTQPGMETCEVLD